MAQAEAAEQKAGNNKTKLKEVTDFYAGIAKRWPDTAAGRDAKAAALRLSGTK
jgi:hypothetical protein